MFSPVLRDVIDTFSRIGAVTNDVAETDNFIYVRLPDQRIGGRECFEVAVNI